MQHAEAFERQRVEQVGAGTTAPAQAVGEEPGIDRQRAIEGVVQRAVLGGLYVRTDLKGKQSVVVTVLAWVATG
ncbi:hypothetical protein D3C72_2362500 [compost metagenome]